MTAMFDLVCLGEPMLELNLQTGDDRDRRLYLEAHGGDASNVVIAAARQGAVTAMLTAIGNDQAGSSFLHLWNREAVDATAVRIDPEHPTGLYFVSHDAAGHHFSYLRKGSAASRYCLDEPARDWIARSRCVFASGISIAISEQAADTVFEAMATARTSGAQVAFDTNYRPKLWPVTRAGALIGEAIRQADIVFPGLEDMALLLGTSDPDRIVDHCLHLGPRMVALKMGAEGALLATPERRRRVPAFPCSPVDATGAGDTFCGCFLATLLETGEPDTAAERATCAAALATTGYGAVPPIPSRAAVLRALEGVGNGALA